MELYIIIIAVIVAVGILISFIMNAKSAKKNINGIIIMALAGVCAVLLMLFGFRFSSFAVYLLFIVTVAVLLLMVFLLMQFVRQRKEKRVRAYANGNAGSTARKLGVKAREILADEKVPSQKISLQEHFAKDEAREISPAPLFDTADDAGVGAQDTPEEEYADESQTMQAEMTTFEPYGAGIAGIADAADAPEAPYEQSAGNEIEMESAGDLPAAITEDIDAESLQETSEIEDLDQEEFVQAAQPFAFGRIQQDMEAREDVQEEPEEAETEPAQESVVLPADEIAAETAVEEISEIVQSETVQAEIEELPEIEEEPSAAADSYEMPQEEIQPEELPEIEEEPAAAADSYEMPQEEIQPEELPEIEEETTAATDSYEMQPEEIQSEELPEIEEETAAAAELKPYEMPQEEIQTEELPEIGEEPAAAADSYEMQPEEIQPEELPEIEEESVAAVELKPYEMPQEEIQTEELPEIEEEPAAAAELKPYEMLQEEIQPEELPDVAEELTADLESLELRQEEENTPAETILVPEETEKEKTILHKAEGLKKEGKYLVAASLFRSAAQNAQNVQNIKYAEFQMLDCLVLAGQTEDAARVMFGILNKKYDLTAGEKLVLKETMTNLHNADR